MEKTGMVLVACLLVKKWSFDGGCLVVLQGLHLMQTIGQRFQGFLW
jgi:hypothetical protein